MNDAKQRIGEAVRATALVIWLVVEVGSFHPLFGGQIQNELVAIEDVLLDSAQANKNREGEVALPIRSSPDEARAVLRFDLSSLEAHAEGEVISATLRLFAEEASGFAQFLRAARGSVRDRGAAILTPSDAVSVHRLTQDWSVSAATWSCPADTGLQNNKADCAAPWDGGSFEAATDDQIIIDGTSLILDFEVGSDLQAFLDGTPNFGWLVQSPVSTTGTGLLRVTSTEGLPAQAPRLLVTFDTDAVAPAIVFVDPPPQTSILLEQPRPRIEVRFSDGGSGLDLASVAILLDTADISSQCAVTGDTTAATTVCSLSSDLIEGAHTIQASVLDADGNQTTLSREIDLLLGPGPHSREIVADADATLGSNVPAQNSGSDPTLTVQDAPTARGLLHFDVSAYELLPQLTDTVFEDLTLRVFAESAAQLGAGRSLDAARGHDLISEDEVTWDCRFDEDPAAAGISCSLPWNGGVFDTPPADTVSVTDGTAGWLTWNLPVSSIEESPSTPFSWFLRFSDDGDTIVSPAPPAVTFTSREGIAGQEPRVGLTFRTPLVGDETPPDVVFTAPIGRTLSSTPAVTLTFSDDQAGVDPSTFQLTLASLLLDITASCTVTASGADCLSPALFDGVHTFIATLADLAGNSSQTIHRVTIGPGPPDIQIVSPGLSVLNDAKPQIEAAFSDLDGDFDPATVRVLVDGVHITSSCIIDLTSALCASPLLAEGSHRLLVVAGDLAGFEASAERIFGVTFDATFPDLAITAPTTHFVLNPRPNISVTYSGTGVDSGTFLLLLDGTDITSTCSVGALQADCKPATSLSEGDHELRASVANTAGNSRTVVRGFDLLPGDGSHVRTLEPVADASISLQNQGSATFLRVAASPDDPTRSIVRFDTSPFDELAAQATVSFEDIVLSLTITDHIDFSQAGMTLDLFPLTQTWEETEATFQCAADEDPATPGTQCAASWSGSLGPLVTSEVVTTFDGAAVFGIGAVGGGLEPSGWALRANPEIDDGQAAPLPRVLFASREHGVLPGPELDVSFFLSDVPDFEPPVLTILSPTTTVINNASPDIELSHTDSQSGVDLTTLAVTVDGVDISIECGLAAPNESSCGLPFALDAGFHTVNAQVADLAGNVATAERVFELMLDTAPPVITLVAPPATVYNDTQPAIEIAYSDDSFVDTSTIEIELDLVDLLSSCTVSATGATCTPPVLAAGSHTLRVLVQDRIHTTEKLFPFEIVLDAAAPTLAVTTPTGTVVGDATPAVTVTFSDAVSGVDTATLQVRVDGFDISGSCVLGLGTAVCEPPALGEGGHTATVAVADLAGNLAGASQTFTVSLSLTDTVPPSLAITAPAGAVVDDPAPAITVAYSDAESDVDLTTLRIAVDGFELIADGRCVVGAISATCTPPLLGAGAHALSAQVEDLANNPATASASFELSFTTVDAVAPVVAITEPAATTIFDDLTPQIAVTYSDADPGVAILTLTVDVDGTDITAGCVLGDASTVCEPPPLTVGTHVVTATVQDLHGNVGSGSFGFDIALTTPDLTPPVIAIAEPATTPVHTDVIPIRVTYSDGETGVHLSSLVITLDLMDLTATCDVGPTQATCTSPVLADGTHTLSASIQDLAGNPALASFGFDVVSTDTTPPVLQIARPVDDVVAVRTPEIEVTYADNSALDLPSFQLTVDQTDFTSLCTVGVSSAICASPTLSDGTHALRATLLDAAGNVGEASRLLTVFIEDSTPPVVTITLPVASTLVDDTSPTLAAAYSDTGSGIDLSNTVFLVDGRDLTDSCLVTEASASCVPLLAAGEHRFEVQAHDRQGNLGSSAFVFEIVLTVEDVNPPTLEFTAPATTVVIDDPAPQIDLSFTDMGAGPDPSTFRLLIDGLDHTDGCTIATGSATCVPPPLALGEHVLSATVRDLAGNPTSASQLLDLQLSSPDTQPPILTILSPPSGTLLDVARVELNLEYSDLESGVDVATLGLLVDGASIPLSQCTVDISSALCDVSGLALGAHVLQASIRDRVGNQTQKQVAFTLNLFSDSSPPVITLDTPVGTVFDDLSPELRFSYQDPESGVDLQTLTVLIDGFEVTELCTAGADSAVCHPPELSTGLHVVDAQVSNSLDITATVSGSFEIQTTSQDLVPPQVTVLAPSETSVDERFLPGFQLILGYQDSGSGIQVSSFRLLLDSLDVTSSCVVGIAQSICSPNVTGLGSHAFLAEVVDGSGNLGSVTLNLGVVAENLPPTLSVVEPIAGTILGDSTPRIRVAYSDRGSGVATSSLQVSVDGQPVGDCEILATEATCEPPTLAQGLHELTAVVEDLRGNATSVFRSFEISLDLEISIVAPVSGTTVREPTVELQGQVSPQADSVTVDGIQAVLQAGTFVVQDLPLSEGSNTVTAVARTANGGLGTATITLVRDTTAPTVVIRSPSDGLVTTASQVLVTGEYNEPASSGAPFTEAEVRIGGVPVEVENRTFFAPDHLLQPGENRIRVEVTDSAGNVGSAETTVTLLTDPIQKIEELLGNGQAGTVGQALPKPLVVRLTDGIGNPLPERPVRFDVTRGDGLVSSAGEEGRSLTVRTDGLGRTQVVFTLGERSGMGNHEVTVTSVGFPGSLVFCASAGPLPAQRIVRIQGNVQTGTLVAAVGEELPKPLYTQVFDEMQNPVSGVPVTYEVVTGGGSFGGEPTLMAETDAHGVATARFTLGPLPGVDAHVVKASIPGAAGGPAVFNITGLQPGPEALTSISGLVLDNQDLPVPNVTVSVHDKPLSAITDTEGRFQIAGAPVGTVHLVADGTTTTLAGTWPLLEFEIVTVSGQDNNIGMPIRLLPIDPGVLVGGDVDVEIPLAGVPGASLTVSAHSVTFPDGSKEGLVSFTQVHNDKVPMVSPLGSMFAVALTIQPPGTLFDPPAQIQIPNPGHKPGEVVDIFSFDHDLGEFVSAGTASVTPDGQFLRSNPGFGVRKAGWHGCAQPVPETDACGPGTTACTDCRDTGPTPKCSNCEVCSPSSATMVFRGDYRKVVSLGAAAATPTVCTLQKVSKLAIKIDGNPMDPVFGKEQEITFKAEGMDNCSSASPITYDWSFGDGETESGEGAAEVTHSYRLPGTYPVKLTASCKGCSSSSDSAPDVMVEVVHLLSSQFKIIENPTDMTLEEDDITGDGKKEKFYQVLGGVRLGLRAVEPAPLAGKIVDYRWSSSTPHFFDGFDTTALGLILGGLEGPDVNEIFWERDWEINLQEEVDLVVTLTDGHEVQDKTRFRTRLIENGVDPGDDIRMLRSVLRLFGYSGLPVCTRGGPTPCGRAVAGNPLAVSDTYDQTARLSASRFQKHSDALVDGRVGTGTLTKMRAQWGDYQEAYESFDTEPRIMSSHALFPTWVVTASTELQRSYKAAFHSAIAPGVPYGNLITSWINQESQAVGHWGSGADFRTTLSEDNLGSIGFNQAQGRFKYGGGGDLIPNVNLYDPASNVFGLARISNSVSAGGGFYRAFLGSRIYRDTTTWGVDDYPRVGRVSSPRSGTTYTDGIKDQLSKGIWQYNSGTRGLLVRNPDATWPEILRLYDSTLNSTDGTLEFGIGYSLRVQGPPASGVGANIPLSSWWWVDQAAITAGGDGACSPGSTGGDDVPISPVPSAPLMVCVCPGMNGILETVRDPGDEIFEFEFEYFESEWVAQMNWLDQRNTEFNTNVLPILRASGCP